MTQPLRATLTEPSLYLPTTATIADIRTEGKREKLFTLQLPPGISLEHQPGQFVEISLLGVGEAPISISSSPSRSNGTFELRARSGRDRHAAHDEVGDTSASAPVRRGFPSSASEAKTCSSPPAASAWRRCAR
jgi:NAD(P)H-flavin reductase